MQAPPPHDDQEPVINEREEQRAHDAQLGVVLRRRAYLGHELLEVRGNRGIERKVVSHYNLDDSQRSWLAKVFAAPVEQGSVLERNAGHTHPATSMARKALTSAFIARMAGKSVAFVGVGLTRLYGLILRARLRQWWWVPNPDDHTSAMDPDDQRLWWGARNPQLAEHEAAAIPEDTDIVLLDGAWDTYTGVIPARSRLYAMYPVFLGEEGGPMSEVEWADRKVRVGTETWVLQYHEQHMVSNAVFQGRDHSLTPEIVLGSADYKYVVSRLSVPREVGDDITRRTRLYEWEAPLLGPQSRCALLNNVLWSRSQKAVLPIRLVEKLVCQARAARNRDEAWLAALQHTADILCAPDTRNRADVIEAAVSYAMASTLKDAAREQFHTYRKWYNTRCRMTWYHFILALLGAMTVIPRIAAQPEVWAGAMTRTHEEPIWFEDVCLPMLPAPKPDDICNSAGEALLLRLPKKPVDQTCRPALSLVQAGPAPATSRVYVHRKCPHMLWNAIMHRVFVCRPATSPWQLELPAVITHHEPPTTTEEWRERFSRGQRMSLQRHEESELAHHPRIKECRAQVKQEKTLKPDKQPRLIQAMDPSFQVLASRHVVAAEKALCLAWDGSTVSDGRGHRSILMASGRTGDELGQWYHEQLRNFRDPVIVYVDVTKADAHHGYHAQQWYLPAYERLGVDPNITRLLLHTDALIGRTRTMGRYAFCVQMTSGRCDTKLCNTLVFVSIAAGAMPPDYALVGVGDDSLAIVEREQLHWTLSQLRQHYANYGYVAKIEHAEVDQGEFCSAVFIPTLGSHTLVPKPGRSLMKACLSVRPQHQASRWMATVAEAFAQAYSAIPPLAEYFHTISERSGRVLSSVSDLSWTAGPSRALPDLDALRAWWLTRYGVSLDAVSDALRWVLSRGAVVVEWAHPVLQQIVNVDALASGWIMRDNGTLTLLGLVLNTVLEEAILEGLTHLWWLARVAYTLIESCAYVRSGALWQARIMPTLVHVALWNMPARSSRLALHVTYNAALHFAQDLVHRRMSTRLAGMSKATPKKAPGRGNEKKFVNVRAKKLLGGPQNPTQPMVMPDASPGKHWIGGGAAAPYIYPANRRQGTMNITPASTLPTAATGLIPRRRQRRVKQVGPAWAGVTAQVARHNAILALEAMADPAHTDARRWPDGDSATIANRVQSLQVLPWVENEAKTQFFTGLIVNPALAGKYTPLDDVKTATGPDWAAAVDEAVLTEYAANFHFYRTTAMSVTVHNYGELMSRGCTVLVCLLPYASAPSGAGWIQELIQLPRTKIMASTEMEVSTDPEQFIWLPLTYQASTYSHLLDPVPQATALSWKIPGFPGSSVSDQQLLVVAYGINGTTAPSDALQVEVHTHYECIPFWDLWFLFPPARALGSPAAIDALTAEVDLAAEDQDAGDPQAFQMAISRVGPTEGGGFFDFIKSAVSGVSNFAKKIGGGIEKGMQIAKVVGDAASAVSDIFGHKLTKIQMQKVRGAHYLLCAATGSLDTSPLASEINLLDFLNSPEMYITGVLRSIPVVVPTPRASV